jgi:nucleoid-associated protein EbfC
MTNFQQLFQLGQQVQARLSQLQTELGNRTITTSSGGGMVNVTADGKGRVRQLRIDPSVVDPNDVEMLEDLIVAAVTEAQQRAEQVYEEEMKKVAGGSAAAVQPAQLSVSAIDELTVELARLPGIGRKTALRLTYHLLKRPADEVRAWPGRSTRCSSASARVPGAAI